MTVMIVRFLPECAVFVHTIERGGRIYDVWRGVSKQVYWIEM